MPSSMKDLIKKEGANFPGEVGDLVEGTVLEIGRNEIYIDLNGLATGVVRGPELFDESEEFSNLKKGDRVTTTIIDLENEKGLIELSIRSAGHQKAWTKLKTLMEQKKVISVKVTDANRGGLITQYGKIYGFLPVSQLKADHYPRVAGGEKNKILEKLKKLIGQNLLVEIIDLDQNEEKLIVSEKEVLREGKTSLGGYKPGDTIEGTVSGLVDFGAFVKFNKNLEGLVHISEIAWQRLDHPKDILKVGDKVKAKIIDLNQETGKFSLSIKKLQKDPWEKVSEKYQIGQIVSGKVLKINPFGIFVELDPEIHGLAHISELSEKPISHPSEIVKIGDILKFKIVSIEPEDHRLGLSIKALKTEDKNKT